jgi:hypothetical protein
VKTAILNELSKFETELRRLRKTVGALTGDRVGQKDIRAKAESLASDWVEKLRSPLEHKFKLESEVIQNTSASMKHLHVLSRPNNRKTSYMETLDAILDGFKDKFVLPIQQTSTDVESVFDLQKLVKGLTNADESEYLKEAIDCANSSYKRASVVIGWCAVIDRIQKKLLAEGLSRFNATSVQLKQQPKGRFKWFNKQFNVSTLNELQEIFDTDLITICEGMGLLDSNQADRLKTVDFQYRNHSAHPGQAPIGDPHIVAFFTDINEIVLTNPKFKV